MTRLKSLLSSGRRCLPSISLVALASAMLAPRVAPAQTLLLPTALRSQVYHWAPFIVRETLTNDICPQTSFEINQMVRVDFDYDVVGTNNVSRAQCGGFPNPDLTATVYFSAVETGTDASTGYYFLTYYWYESRDAGYWAGSVNHDDGHDHDVEGAMLIIKKHPFSPWGELVDVVTQAHGALLPWKWNGSSVNGAPVTRDMGDVQWWNDYRETGHSRPVTISAAGDHATYMPQLCGYGYSGDRGFGIVDLTASSGRYEVCVHDGTNAIIYQPMLEAALDPSSGLSQGDQLSTGYTGTGFATYQLIELSQSPMWSNRTSTALFSGSTLTLPGGLSALPDFNPGGANPPWQWQGVQSCHVGQCYYLFSGDGTNTFDDEISLPTTASGTFLAAPAVDVGQRFNGLPELNAPARYNPYVASPPDYNGNYPLAATIDGPQMIPAGIQETWNASISGGTAPYTIQWSGALSGSATSVSGSLSSDAVLYLDVWDAHGAHVAVSIYITVCQNGEISC
jgi:hypothetical protein